jgi:hypothetical protein
LQPELRPHVDQIGVTRPDPTLIERPQAVHSASDLRHGCTVTDEIRGDRPQRLAGLDDMDPVA